MELGNGNVFYNAQQPTLYKLLVCGLQLRGFIKNIYKHKSLVNKVYRKCHAFFFKYFPSRNKL